MQLPLFNQEFDEAGQWFLGSWTEKVGVWREKFKPDFQSGGAWQKVSGIVMDKRMSLKLKSLIYKSSVRPVLRCRSLGSEGDTSIRELLGESHCSSIGKMRKSGRKCVIGIREKVQESRLGGMVICRGRMEMIW